jgi:hypothetical protein
LFLVLVFASLFGEFLILLSSLTLECAGHYQQDANTYASWGIGAFRHTHTHYHTITLTLSHYHTITHYHTQQILTLYLFDFLISF